VAWRVLLVRRSHCAPQLDRKLKAASLGRPESPNYYFSYLHAFACAAERHHDFEAPHCVRIWLNRAAAKDLQALVKGNAFTIPVKRQGSEP